MRSDRRIKIAICDDEANVSLELSKKLNDILKADGGFAEIESFTAPEALIKRGGEGSSFDVIFMDIDWEGRGKGIEAAERLSHILPNASIIYITGYSERYVEQVFLRRSRLRGLLKKPINEDVLKSLLKKALEDEKSARRGKFSFSNRGGVYTIDYNDIIFLESKGHSLVIHTGSGVCHEMNGKLDDIETGFPDNFIRCHKSYLVNMDWPDRIDKKQHKFVIDSGKRPNAEDKECIVPISKFRYKGTRDKYLKYLTLKG